MYNDDAISREPPSVERSIVFFIHAVLTCATHTYRHPSFDPFSKAISGVDRKPLAESNHQSPFPLARTCDTLKLKLTYLEMNRRNTLDDRPWRKMFLNRTGTELFYGRNRKRSNGIIVREESSI